MTDNPPFAIGARVRKASGYIFEGVVAACYQVDGRWKVDAKLTTVPPGGNGHGILHIFAPEQLREGWKVQTEAAKNWSPASHHVKADDKHPSHITRHSDSSLYDEVCVNCGATDISGGGWGRLGEPCPKMPDADGWIPWAGEEMPLIEDGVQFAVRLRGGWEGTDNRASRWRWRHWEVPSDIIAYRATKEGRDGN